MHEIYSLSIEVGFEFISCSFATENTVVVDVSSLVTGSKRARTHTYTSAGSTTILFRRIQPKPPNPFEK